MSHQPPYTHLLIGDLQQVEHHSVGAHVLQQPLLLHSTLLTGVTQLTQTHKDLQITTHYIHATKTTLLGT